MDDEQILELLTGDNRIKHYILSRGTLLCKPQQGSMFILPSGEFLLLSDDHESIFTDTEDTLDVNQDEIKQKLAGLQWIRCNSALGDMSYLVLNATQPTSAQYDAIEEFADLALAGKGERLSVIYVEGAKLNSETFSELVAGFQVVKSIKKLYASGVFIPSSAFEALIKEPEVLTQEEIKRRTEAIFTAARRKGK